MNRVSFIDYSSFLSRHDLVWNKLPHEWDEAPFHGNGVLGSLIYTEKNDLILDIGNAYVYDHRQCSRAEQIFYRCRLPIGNFAFHFDEPLNSIKMRLELYDAQTKGTLHYGDKQSINFQTYVHAEENLIFFRFIDSFYGEYPEVSFIPKKAVSPRHTYGIKYNETSRIFQNYIENPEPEITENNGIFTCVQNLICGGQTVTAWKWEKYDGGMMLIATVSHSAYDHNAYTDAVELIGRTGIPQAAKFFETHKMWWHSFYQRSFLSISDTALESFYWIQMYKLGSATRPGGAIMDNQGPWLAETPWPSIWWNLNVQLAYSPVFASNHTDLFEAVWKSLKRNLDSLIENVPEEYRYDSAGIGTRSDLLLRSPMSLPSKDASGLVEIGNLIWVMHSCWLYYRMNMDEEFLVDTLYPLLKRSVSLVLHYTYEEDDKIHICATASPEYGVIAEDTNYELSLLKWGLKTLLYINNRHSINDPRMQEWESILSRLADYPIHEDEGYMIAKGVRYEQSHRHYSHMLMVYPLYLVNIDTEDTKELVKKSVEHWQSLPEMLQGYSCTGAASIYASLGDGDTALSYLQGLWRGFLRYNTLYKESGPVIETPLSAAQSIHDMLIQSWGGKLRVFPAVPSVWKDVTFESFRAEGGFIVSAQRRKGVTDFIRVKSLHDEPLVIISDIENINSNMKERISQVNQKTLSVKLYAGEEIIVYRDGYEGGFNSEPVEADLTRCNVYGMNEKTESIVISPRKDNRID